MPGARTLVINRLVLLEQHQSVDRQPWGAAGLGLLGSVGRTGSTRSELAGRGPAAGASLEGLAASLGGIGRGTGEGLAASPGGLAAIVITVTKGRDHTA